MMHPMLFSFYNSYNFWEGLLRYFTVPFTRKQIHLFFSLKQQSLIATKEMNSKQYIVGAFLLLTYWLIQQNVSFANTT